MKACVTSRILNRRADGTPVPFTEVISFAKEAGFEEFDMTLPARLYRQADWERELDARGEALAKAGMRVKSCTCPTTTLAPTMRKAGRATMKPCAAALTGRGDTARTARPFIPSRS